MRPGIVHRLDAGTSGLMVVARSSRAYESLVDALTRRDVTRVYNALVWGHPEVEEGGSDAPIAQDSFPLAKLARGLVADRIKSKPGQPHDDRGLIEQVGQGISKAFAEDNWIIEAQQKAWDASPAGTQPMSVRNDAALGRVRFMIEQLLREEQTPPPPRNAA